MTSKKQPSVVVETTQGTFELELNPAVAPKACDNFLQLVEKKLRWSRYSPYHQRLYDPGRRPDRHKKRG